MIQYIREFLRGRAGSYRRVFLAGSPDAEFVLRDLAKFCRAHESTGGSERLDGRREVWLRIQQHLRLSDEDLWKMFGGNKINLPATNQE